MKALNILKNLTTKDITFKKICEINEAIKELEAYITNYQEINRRLNNTVITLSVLGHQNKSLVTILEKYNKETIELKKENKDLKERSI